MSDDIATKSNTLSVNLKGLDDLIRTLKQKPPTVRIGVLGTKNGRGDGKTTNAQIGAKHEFGDTETPRRSWLRAPLIEHLNNYIEKSQLFSKDAVAEALEAKSLVPLMKKVGLVAEAVIADGFASGGFGKWKPSNMVLKKNQQTLVETGQLRDSVASEVVEK